MEFEALRALCHAILLNAGAYRWTLHGLGMLRLYLQDARLHVWDSHFAQPGVSTIHTHPWDFRSLVISGTINNRRYTYSDNGIPHRYQTIHCGEGGGLVGSPEGCRLHTLPIQTKTRGDHYHQLAHEIHESLPADGTVTYVARQKGGEYAKVFWPEGREWVSAEPREATLSEVLEITQRALGVWDR